MADKSCIIVTNIIFYLAFGVALPIACLVIGQKYEGQCPAEPRITLYLYISGAFCLIRGIVAFIEICMACRDCSKGAVCIAAVFDILLGVFLFAWFIAGSVWVYKLKDNFDTSDPEDPRYCQPELYKFTFGILTTQWILNAVSMVLNALVKCCCRD